MTYKELEELCKGKQLPLATKNEDGENIVIERKCDKWTYGTEHWERNYFQITTAEEDGWLRINMVGEEGKTEGFFVREEI